MIKQKKSQIWGLDLMAAVMIMAIGLMIFFVYALNSSSDTKQDFDYLYYEGNFIMDLLLSQGYPNDWNASIAPANWVNIKSIGLITNERIDDNKIEAFYNMNNSVGGYNQMKKIFNTRYDFYFILDSDGTVTNNDIDCDNDDTLDCNGIGKNYTTATTHNLMKITRFTIYKNKPTTAYLYIWE